MEKSLQRSRPFQLRARRHATRAARHGTNWISSPSRRMKKWLETSRPRNRSIDTDGRAGRDGSGRDRSPPVPPNSPGGRLMLCTTSRRSRLPVGRSSKFGDGICSARASRPSHRRRYPLDAIYAASSATAPGGDDRYFAELRGRGYLVGSPRRLGRRLRRLTFMRYSCGAFHSIAAPILLLAVGLADRP